MKSDEIRKELEAKQQHLHAIFAEAGEDMDMSQVKSLEGDGRQKAAEIRRLNEEMSATGKELEDQLAIEGAGKAVKDLGDRLNKPAGGMVHPSAGGSDGQSRQPVKTFGQLFIESPAFKEFKGHEGPVAEIDIPVKTLFETSAGWAPETIRTGRLVDYASLPPQLLDFIPQTTTGQAAVVYMEETTQTSGAAEAAEAGLYGESTLALTERSSTVRKTATFLPITDEQMEDVPQVQDYVDNRLTMFLRQRLELQILTGNGVAPNLQGILGASNVQSQAKSSDATPDAIFKAMTKVRVTGAANPNLVVLHPNDWQAIRLLTTTDGVYIWGSPADSGPERIWGLPVVQASRLTENTGLVGDFAGYCALAVRRGIEVQVSNSHSDYFVYGKQAIRADIRAAFVIYRPSAFCLVTGI
jgi:HK97 family phage major capsid protein